jgi:AcrR family transcriptional regulator
MPRKKRQIDLDKVRLMGRFHPTDEEIAAELGVSRRTVTTYKQDEAFLEALEQGRAQGKMTLRRLQWKTALNGSVPMQIFLGKNLLGQSDQVKHEHDIEEGGTLHGVLVVPQAVNTEDWAKQSEDHHAKVASGPPADL